MAYVSERGSWADVPVGPMLDAWEETYDMEALRQGLAKTFSAAVPSFASEVEAST